MSATIPNSYPSWIKYFYIIDSTNNYAKELVRKGDLTSGQIIWARFQKQGKGQRGKAWEDHEENLKFSLIINTQRASYSPLFINLLTVVSLSELIHYCLDEKADVRIKWPNDIYINDKKACGILIENIFKGAKWQASIIGIGLNVNQRNFPKHLSHATSMRQESPDKIFHFIEIITNFRNKMMAVLSSDHSLGLDDLLIPYNQRLFKKGEKLWFEASNTGQKFIARVLNVNTDGALVLEKEGAEELFANGEVVWLLDERVTDLPEDEASSQ